MKKRTADFLYIILIFAVVFFMIFVVYYLTTESGMCMNNPFVYGARKLGDVECSCFKYGDTKQPISFMFNSSVLFSKIDNENIGLNLPGLNISMLP